MSDAETITVHDVDGRPVAFPWATTMTVMQLMEAVQKSFASQTPIDQQRLLFKRTNIAVCFFFL